jgi:single-strand DNA-binding protein
VSKSLNSVNLTGYLGADPQLHTFDDGTEVANLRLAVSRSKKQDGEWVDDTIWVDVKAFGKQAQAIGQYLGKGSFVCVSGQLAQPRTWQDQNGETRYTMVVDHALVTFGPKAEGASTPAAPKAKTTSTADYSDGDIPF